MSYLRLARGEFDLAESLALEAVEGAAAAGCHWVHSYALHVLGWSAAARGDADTALRWYELGLEIARNESTPYPFQIGTLLESEAEVFFNEGDFERAEPLAREAIALLAPFNERYGIGFAQRCLGWIRYLKADRAEALELWRHAYAASNEVDDPWQMADSLAAFARAALDAGNPDLAARGLGVADALRERSGRRRLEYHDTYLLTLEQTRERLSPERFNDAWQSGISLGPGHVWAELEDAALEANAGTTTSPATPSTAPRMTPRELEILKLLVAGKTDREIAGELFVSVRTIEHHVSRICGKLGVRTRTAAATTSIAAKLVLPGEVPPAS